MSFITKLNAVVETLKADPSILLAHYRILPPNPEAITKVEALLGYKLDSAITDFYKECGGIQLLWLHENNDHFDRLPGQLPLDESELNDWYIKGEHMNFFPEGSIWIPSIESVFTTDWTQNGLEFDSAEFDEALTKNYEGFKIQVFDWFSGFNDVAFLINGTSNPPLVLGDDNQAVYNESHVIDFNLYLELLLKSKGSIDTRVGFLNKNSNDELDEPIQLKHIDALEVSI
jgi:hypothetical protein